MVRETVAELMPALSNSGVSAAVFNVPAAVASPYLPATMPSGPVTNLDTLPIIPAAGQTTPVSPASAIQFNAPAPARSNYEYREGEADTGYPIPLNSLSSSKTSQIEGVSTYELDLTDKQVDELIDEPLALQPVSFTPSSAAAIQAAQAVHTVEIDNSVIKHAGHARVSVDNETGVAALERGEILVVSQKQSTIKVGVHTVTIQAGAIERNQKNGSGNTNDAKTIEGIITTAEQLHQTVHNSANPSPWSAVIEDMPDAR